jgi:16S rRNA G966 N2-methylase RsmD
VYPGGIQIWIDNAKQYLSEVSEVEGVDSISLPTRNPIFVYVDPRYDKNEVANEIKILLSSNVPSVFRED